MFDDMKEVYLYINGNYDKFKKEIKYKYYLTYKQNVVKRVGYISEEGSAFRSELQSIYMALQDFREPCKIHIVSRYPINLKRIVGAYNKDLIVKIQKTINKAGHIIYFETDKNLEHIKEIEANRNNSTT